MMKVLIAVDPSPSTQRVIEEAAARPWPLDTSFSIVHVVDLQRFIKQPMLVEDAKRAGEQAVTPGGREAFAQNASLARSNARQGSERGGIDGFR